MTFKEKMMEIKPKYVKSEWRGGVYGCPYCYGLESSEESNKNCESNNGKGCDYCWNREMPEEKGEMSKEFFFRRISKKEKAFAKPDLENGMIVEYRKGEKRIVVNDRLLGLNSWNSFESYDDILMNCYDSEYDICAVYKSENIYSLKEILEKGYGLEEIWRRKEPVKFTVKEAEEKLKELLGEEVKIS